MTVQKEAEEVTLDDVLFKIGSFSPHQIKSLLLLGLAFIGNSIYCMNYVFTAEDVPYSCNSKECSTGKEKWECDVQIGPNTTVCSPVLFNSSVTVTCNDWSYDVKNSFVSEYDLACDDWKRTSVGTVHNIGVMIGLIIQGQLSDRIGRKAVICIVGVLAGVFGLAKSFAASYSIFMLLEFLESTFGDNYSPCFILCIESVHSSKRLISQGFISVFSSIAGVIMAFSAWWLPYWRDYVRAVYAPSLLLFVYCFLLDESPRWLLINGKSDVAVKQLLKSAESNKVAIDKGMLQNVSGEDQSKTSASPLRETFKSKLVVKRFLICTVWWVTCTFVSFGLVINSVSIGGNKYLNFGLISLTDIPASVVVIFVLKYFRRKKPLIVSFLLAGLLCISQIFIPRDCIWTSTLVYFLGKATASFTFATVYIYTSELFPTYTRNSMLALCSSIGRIGCILAPMTPLLSKYMENLPVILFGVCSLVSGFLALLVPDTGDIELPDTVQQAERIGNKECINKYKFSK